MAFYRADKENDRERDVARHRKYRISDFWSSGSADQNFLITGGGQNEQIWGLYYAVENYLEKKGRPVIILHNNKNLDATFYPELKAHFPEINYWAFGNPAKAYEPFAGMNKEWIMEVLRELCDGMLEVEAYAEAFLNVLACYEKSLGLHNIRRLCGKSDEEILQLARRAGLGQPSGITQNVTGGIRFRRVISNLSGSAKNIFSANVGMENSVTAVLKNPSGRQVISITVGSGNTDVLLKYLSGELLLLEDQEFLVVVYDLGVKEENGLGNLLTKTSAHYAIGLCSEEIYGMFLDHDDKTYQAVRGRIKKKLILRYTDAQAAEKISDIAGCYDKTVRHDITAPTMPWTIIKPRAKGKPKQKYPRLEADELTQMQAEAAILQGHRGHSIYFVQRVEYY